MSSEFFQKCRGAGAALPPRAPAWRVGAAALGAVAAIGVLAFLTESLKHPWVLGSFGASCVLLFGFPEAPFSQPRNVILGHTFSSLIGLGALQLFGPHGWGMAVAVGAAIAVMMLTRTVHPPAGSNPVIVFLMQPGWSFLLFPTLAGAIALVLIATLYLNLWRKSSYPQYWLGRSASPAAAGKP